MALGGSTNAVLHLIAMARAAAVEVTLDDFQVRLMKHGSQRQNPTVTPTTRARLQTHLRDIRAEKGTRCQGRACACGEVSGGLKAGYCSGNAPGKHKETTDAASFSWLSRSMVRAVPG